MDFAALAVAVAALAFTIGSFWWLNARPGELQVYRPATFGSGYGSNLVLYLPLIVHNTGPTSMALIDVRAWFDFDADQPFVWQAYDPELPGRKQERHMARPLVVPPRRSVEWVFEFQRSIPDGITGDQAYEYEFWIEVRAEASAPRLPMSGRRSFGSRSGRWFGGRQSPVEATIWTPTLWNLVDLLI